MNMIEGVLYIHIPFCARKCAYCDFNSTTYDHAAAERYLAALAKESALRGADFRPKTIFIGGGTPTALNAAQMRALMEMIRRDFALDDLKEFTIEANPATVNIDKARTMLDAGVNRVSIGVQSFHDNLLRKLGRIHTARNAEETYALLRRAGFKNISLDLIFSIPGETERMWEEDLARACGMAPEHISAYCLTYEPETPLGRDLADGRVTPLPEDVEAEMYLRAIDFLPSHGYEQYEISNYAKPGFECAHNIAYWLNANSLGLGTGAFSYINGTRSSNARDIAEYTTRMESGSAKVFEETLGKEDAAREAVMLGLRMRVGIERDDFLKRTGVALDTLLNEQILALTRDGFFEDDAKTFRVSRKGLPVTDSLLLHFMP